MRAIALAILVLVLASIHPVADALCEPARCADSTLNYAGDEAGRAGSLASFEATRAAKLVGDVPGIVASGNVGAFLVYGTDASSAVVRFVDLTPGYAAAYASALLA